MINDRLIKRLIEISYALKEKGVTGRAFHVSFILKKSRVLSISSNNYLKTHPQTRNFGYKTHNRIHSELGAALKLGLNDFSGLTLFNVRINRNNQLDMSCPCLGCQNLIKSLNFKSVYYTDGDSTIKEFIF